MDTLFLSIVATFLLQSALGAVQTIGVDPVTLEGTDLLLDGSNKVFLRSAQTFSQDSIVTEIEAAIGSDDILTNDPDTRVIHFQIWRPVSGKQYTLLEERVVIVEELSRTVKIPVTTDECFIAKAGDVIAFMNNASKAGPIAKTFGKPSDLLYFTYTSENKPVVGSDVTFISALYPYTFQFNVKANTDIPTSCLALTESSETTPETTPESSTESSNTTVISSTPTPRTGGNTSNTAASTSINAAIALLTISIIALSKL
ncbi:unnamed protein product [Owenia fusiformis]|uniref:Uncharacterized protein n=1 Tax=Owenia fusiformis TaxID=6347 RepID=A0A8J1TWY3_OWEFU|nr:unnamed protein product [Owenia fusiformis]